MTELEKIEYAKSFIDKLAQGINPIDDSLIPDGDIANNVRLSRCFFYVSDILRRVIENGGIEANVPKPKKADFRITPEQRENIRFSREPISVSVFTDILNETADTENMTKLTAVMITKWLQEKGLLQTIVRADGKNAKMPTENGRAMGISTEEMSGKYGNYTIVLYNTDMQKYIVDSIDEIVALKKSAKESKKEASDPNVWTAAQDEALIGMFRRGAAAAEMAHELGKTVDGIRGRLAYFGLIG